MAEVLRRLAALLESAALLGLGVYMLAFALGDGYWLLLNPKFRWLTIAAGAVLCVLGLAALVLGRRRGSWGRLMLMLLMALLFAGVDTSALVGGADTISEAPPVSRTAPSRLERGGRDYVKINAMELFSVAQAANPAQMAEGYVWRAVARRAPGLAPGEFVALRTSVFCCLADAVAVGFVVRAAGPPPADGQWVRLWGHLQKPPKPIVGAGIVSTRGVFMSVASDDWLFQADAVEPIGQPPVPFSFVFNQKEPYAY